MIWHRLLCSLLLELFKEQLFEQKRYLSKKLLPFFFGFPDQQGSCATVTVFYYLAILFRWREDVHIKKVFPNFRTSSEKPGASILGESLGQEEPNDTSNMRIGPADSLTHTGHYSYLLKIDKNKGIVLTKQPCSFFRMENE